MPIDDGLDALTDEQLLQLVKDSNIPRGPGTPRLTKRNVKYNRKYFVNVLRDAGVSSPYSREPSTQSIVGQYRQKKADTDMGLPSHPADTDIEEYQYIQSVIDEHYDTDMDAGNRVDAWRVQLSSGNEVVVYGTVSAFVDLEQDGFTIDPVDDNTMVDVQEEHTPFVDPTKGGTYVTAYDTSVSKRRQAPKLPARRLGKHQLADVHSLEEQRQTPPERGRQPSTPMQYPESSPPVVHFPRHRRR